MELNPYDAPAGASGRSHSDWWRIFFGRILIAAGGGATMGIAGLLEPSTKTAAGIAIWAVALAATATFLISFVAAIAAGIGVYTSRP